MFTMFGHWAELIPCIWFMMLAIIPWIIGFTWLRDDANRHGHPGIIWATLTIPFGWLAVLVYLVVRATAASNRGY